MADTQILVVDDDEDMLNLVTGALTRNGFQVSEAGTGKAALDIVKKQRLDLIVLDLMLPDMDGTEVCRQIKQNPSFSDVPVIMVTARDEEDDVVRGLGLGAVDYITKPFSSKILVARVQAALRQKPTPVLGQEPLEREGIYMHPGRHEVKVDGEKVDLTSTEFKILYLLASHPGWVFNRYQIVDAVHGEGHAVTDRSIDVQIGVVRRKLGESGELIETVRGVGYRFQS
jgi:two-component system phosphate regulon response regulator PhoB